MSSPPQVSLRSGYKGFVSGVVNASLRQRAFCEVKDGSGNPITSATFEGQGGRVPMTNVFNNRPYWSFGPFSYTANLFITISNYENGQWKVSKMVGPISISKAPEPDYPMSFELSTVISEDGHNQSHDDCTVKVLQYKD